MVVSLESNAVSLKTELFIVCNIHLYFALWISGHFIQACWCSYCNRYNKGFQQGCYQVTQALLYLIFLVQKGCFRLFIAILELITIKVLDCCFYLCSKAKEIPLIFFFFCSPWLTILFGFVLFRCLDSVPQSAIDYFKESAQLLIQEKGPVNALAAALAHISGATSIEQRSLLNSDAVSVFSLMFVLNLKKNETTTKIPVFCKNSLLTLLMGTKNIGTINMHVCL